MYAATSKQGPGVSTDGAMMLATAENVARGHGLIDYRGLELTQFPPLYSLLLAMGSILFQKDVFTIGWTLNIIAFAALIWCSGLCFRKALTEEPILAYFATFIVFSSASLIIIFANIATDPLFVLMVLSFLMIMSAYIRANDRRLLIAAGLLAIIACFQRYAGLALVISGALIVAYQNRSAWKAALLRSAAFTLLTATPIFLWGYLHNAPVNGTVFGGRLPALPGPNFITGLEKLLYWFIPLQIITRAGPLLLAGLIAAVLIAAALALKVTGVVQKLRSAEVLPHLVFVAVYGAVLVFDISYYELKGINTDRVHIVMLPSLLVVLLALATGFLRALKARVGTRLVYSASIALFVLWAIFPISRSYGYIHDSRQAGDASSYNSINKGNILTSPLAQELMGVDVKDKKVYTNGSDSAWFILHTQIEAIPRLKSEDRAGYLRQQYGGWPGEGKDGYVVWFNYEAHKESYATPEELMSIAVLREVYRDEEGAIYYVSNR